MLCLPSLAVLLHLLEPSVCWAAATGTTGKMLILTEYLEDTFCMLLAG